MRGLVDRARLDEFMTRLGGRAQVDAECLLIGGATAVALGWRDATIDIDLELVPQNDDLLRAVAELKHALGINVELVSTADFIPPLPGADERSLFETKRGHLTFRHVDPYAQALAKLERGHARDVADVKEMARRGLIESTRLRELFAAIEPELFRYPAIDPPSFASAVAAAADALAGLRSWSAEADR
ncbi:MAG: DUF6036 family nucleotidyltransferase [Gaiellales bacterium]